MKTLRDYWKEMAILKSAGSLHYWDLETQMPSMGGAWRGEVLGYFAGQTHALMTNDDYFRLLQTEAQGNRKAAEALKDVTKARLIPQSFVEEMTRSQTASQIAWEKAKKEKNYHLFKDHLKKMIEMKKQYAHYVDPTKNTYDVLLDEFSPNLTQKDFDALFHPLKEKLTQLVKSYSPRKTKKWHVSIEIQGHVFLIGENGFASIY